MPIGARADDSDDFAIRALTPTKIVKIVGPGTQIQILSFYSLAPIHTASAMRSRYSRSRSVDIMPMWSEPGMKLRESSLNFGPRH